MCVAVVFAKDSTAKGGIFRVFAIGLLFYGIRAEPRMPHVEAASADQVAYGYLLEKPSQGAAPVT